MALPENKEFREAIQALQVVFARQPPKEPHQRLGPPGRHPSDGQVVDRDGSLRSPAYLCSDQSAQIGLPSLLKRLSSELRSAGHPKSDQREVVAGFLALFCLDLSESEDPVEALNRFVASLRRTSLTLMTVCRLPALLLRRRARIGSFRIGPPDTIRVRQLVEDRALSGLPWDISQRWSLGYAVEREPLEVLCADWSRLRETSHELLRPVLDDYYSAIAEAHAADFERELQEELALLTASGAGDVHPGLYSKLRSRRPIDFVGVFTWAECAGDRAQYGWAVATSTAETLLSSRLDETVDTFHRWLEEEFGYERDSHHPLDETIKSYARFLVRALRHEQAGSQDEAFLHRIIALDLVLGSQGSSSASVSSRVAAITHAPLGAPSYPDEQKRIKQLYDARSRYVHEGKSPPLEQRTQAAEVCREVLWSLLRLRGTISSETPEALGIWHRRLDYLSRLHDHPDGKAIEELELEAAGIASSPVPPPRCGRTLAVTILEAS